MANYRTAARCRNCGQWARVVLDPEQPLGEAFCPRCGLPGQLEPGGLGSAVAAWWWLAAAAATYTVVEAGRFLVLVVMTLAG